jgi:hypothetical protein
LGVFIPTFHTFGLLASLLPFISQPKNGWCAKLQSHHPWGILFFFLACVGGTWKRKDLATNANPAWIPSSSEIQIGKGLELEMW